MLELLGDCTVFEISLKADQNTNDVKYIPGEERRNKKLQDFNNGKSINKLRVTTSYYFEEQAEKKEYSKMNISQHEVKKQLNMRYMYMESHTLRAQGLMEIRNVTLGNASAYVLSKKQLRLGRILQLNSEAQFLVPGKLKQEVMERGGKQMPFIRNSYATRSRTDGSSTIKRYQYEAPHASHLALFYIQCEKERQWTINKKFEYKSLIKTKKMKFEPWIHLKQYLYEEVSMAVVQKKLYQNSLEAKPRTLNCKSSDPYSKLLSFGNFSTRHAFGPFFQFDPRRDEFLKDNEILGPREQAIFLKFKKHNKNDSRYKRRLPNKLVLLVTQLIKERTLNRSLNDAQENSFPLGIRNSLNVSFNAPNFNLRLNIIVLAFEAGFDWLRQLPENMQFCENRSLENPKSFTKVDSNIYRLNLNLFLEIDKMHKGSVTFARCEPPRRTSSNRTKRTVIEWAFPQMSFSRGLWEFLPDVSSTTVVDIIKGDEAVGEVLVLV
ncbi:hypothetical protein HUJ04_000636 [Dendroctonus ponderosae]|nr:hypothetical protein HUJ04_000636 [Dendroctonus ponderosae]